MTTAHRLHCHGEAARKRQERRRKLSGKAVRPLAGWWLLAVLLPLLAGCAALEVLRPASGSGTPVGIQGASTAAPADGRSGFEIRETPVSDDGARRQFERAVALLQDDDFEQAAELLEAVVARVPDVAAPHINLAIAYERLGRAEAAEAHLQIALAVVPGHPVAANVYGMLCRRAGRFAEARAIYEGSLERFPDYYPVRRNLAILCDLYLDDLESALIHYERYSADRPEEPQVKIWIADLRNRMGLTIDRR